MPEAETNKGGRPTVVTEAVVLKLEEAFRVDATDEEACSYAGIGERTYYDHLKNDEAFRSRMHSAQLWPFLMMKQTVVKAAKEGDSRTAMKWLERRQRERYFTKAEQTVKMEKDGAAELAEALLGDPEATPKPLAPEGESI